MPQTPRRFDDPVVCLPRQRISLHDRHHLFWPCADFRRYDLADFRSLGCTSAVRFDSTVHSLVHQRFAGILPLEATDLTDLRLRSNRCLERHFNRNCACLSADRLLVVDALSLEAYKPQHYSGPMCAAILADYQVYELMRDYYRAVAPITQTVRLQLSQRCDDGLCACLVQQGGNQIRQPAVWQQLRLRAA